MGTRPVRVSIFLVTVACSLGLALAQSFDARTRTVSVAPSGSDDTLAIATAFEICLEVGPGCTVQLEAGRYNTRQQHVAGFQGTLTGAGMEVTLIEPITPYRVSPARVDVSVRAPDPGGAPVMFTFRDANVELERVSIDAGPGVTFGASVFNGVFVLPGPAQSDDSMAANVRVAESRIRGPLSGIAFGDLEASSVVIRGNVIEGGMAVELANIGSSLVEVVGNELSGGDPAVIGLVVAEGRRLAGPTTLLLSGNSVRVRGGDRSSGLFLEDLGNPAHQRAIVIDNRFELDGSLAAVAGDADGAVVRDNVVSGTAVSGIRVGGKSPASFDSVAKPWLVVRNDLSGLETSGVSGVAIRVTHRSRNSVVVCGGRRRCAMPAPAPCCSAATKCPSGCVLVRAGSTSPGSAGVCWPPPTRRPRRRAPPPRATRAHRAGRRARPR